MENNQKEEAIFTGIDLANGPDKSSNLNGRIKPKTKTKAIDKNKSKTFGNTDQSKCKDNVPDVVMFGGDLFVIEQSIE